jgi:hypothetical protein
VPGDKIGVKMRQKNMRDFQPVLIGKRDVLIDVALRIDDGCCASCLVTDHVGCMSQARQIKLLEDQGAVVWQEEERYPHPKMTSSNGATRRNPKRKNTRHNRVFFHL